MAKIDLNKAAEILKKNHLEPGVMRRIIEEFNLAVQPEPGEETAPPVKKQFVILVSDPDGRWPKHDFAGWVLQIPESESPATSGVAVVGSVTSIIALPLNLKGTVKVRVVEVLALTATLGMAPGA